MADCLLVRVNPRSTSSLDGVVVYTANGKYFPGSNVASGTVICFKEDPTPDVSRVTGFTLSKDTCGSCVLAPPPGADPKSLYLRFSPGLYNPDQLLLDASVADSTGRVVMYRARNNDDQIQGGKPIIRNTFDHLILVAGVTVAVAALGYLLWRYFFRPDPPPDGLREQNRASGPA